MLILQSVPKGNEDRGALYGPNCVPHMGQTVKSAGLDSWEMKLKIGMCEDPSGTGWNIQFPFHTFQLFLWDMWYFSRCSGENENI